MGKAKSKRAKPISLDEIIPIKNPKIIPSIIIDKNITEPSKTEEAPWKPLLAIFKTTLHIPSNIKEGDYQLALWLPDEYESLRDNPLYAIRFANENIFDGTTGYNSLGLITISKNTTGQYTSGKDFIEIHSNP